MTDFDDATRAGHPDESALDRWRTDELEGEERAWMAAHMESCEECRRALAELEAFSAAVGRAYAADRELAAAEEPDWSRVQARVAEGVAAADRAGREAPPRRSAWSRWAPQAAAAVVALVVVGVLWREGVRGPDDARQIVEPEASAISDRAAEPFIAEEEDADLFGPESEVAAPGPPAQGQETETLGRTRVTQRDGAEDLRAAGAFRDEAQRRDAAAEERLADQVAPSRDQAAPQEGARVAAPPPADREEANLEERANAKAAPQEAQNEAAAAAPENARFGVEGVEVEPTFSFTPYTVKPRCTDGCTPADVLRHLPPSRREVGVRCDLTLGLQIDTTGAVTATQILQSSGNPWCDQAAREWARTTRWTTAYNRDQPVVVWIAQPVRITQD